MKRTVIAFVILICLSGLAAGRVQAKAIPDQAYISGVVGHAQIYSLSCEARSAADWAAYWGVAIDETEFLNRLPRSDNPNEGFVGNPDDPWGYIPPNSYGVHADPIANLLRSYGLDAHAGHGVSWDEVRGEVAAGRPVIVWVIGSIWAGSPSEFETEDGQIVTVANNEHTMIVIGYDENRVHLVDALTGATITHTLGNFLSSWSVLGNMAVIGEGSGEDPADQEASDPQGEGSPDGYMVQAGDTLNKVADRLNLEWTDLAAWNDISYPYIIYTGQILLTGGGAAAEPAPEEPAADTKESYTVQRSDQLLSIARDLEIDWEALVDFNALTPPYLLRPGDVLRLPGGEDTTAAEIEVPETYTAMRSESLFALAHYFQLDWIRLAGMNNLAYPYLLAPGQTIRLK